MKDKYLNCNNKKKIMKCIKKKLKTNKKPLDNKKKFKKEKFKNYKKYLML